MGRSTREGENALSLANPLTNPFTPIHAAAMSAPWGLTQVQPRPLGGAAGTIDQGRAQAYLDTMEWLSRQPILPLDDLTARRRDCIVRTSHAGWLMDVADMVHEAISDSGSISGILNTITKGIPRLPITVQGPPVIAQALTGDDERAGLMSSMLPRSQQAKALYWGIPVGVVPVRILRDQNGFGPSRGRNGPRATRRIEVWETRFLRYEWGVDTWYLNTALGPIPIEDLKYPDGSPEFVLWKPYDSARPWRLAPWRYLSLMAIFARDAGYARARHAQVLSPRRVVEYTEFWSEPQRAKMIQILENMSYNGYLLLPPGTKFSIANVGGNDITQVYGTILNWCREEVEIGLTGQRVTTEGGKGFSSGDVQRDIAEAQLDFYASSWAEFCSEHVVTPCMRDNYGDDIDPIAYSFDTESTDRKVERAKALSDLGSAMVTLRNGADAIGADISAQDPAIQHLFRKFGITLRAKPASAVPVTKLELAPTDLAKVVRVNEVRAAQGLPLDPGSFGQKYLSEIGEGATPNVPASPEGATNVG